MDQRDQIAAEVRKEYLSDLILTGSPRGFVNELDRRFDRIYLESVDRYFKAPPWDLPGVSLAVCCYLAWGEVRSVDTFTRQAVELGFDRPRLRLLLSKQIYEEMVHHQMFRQAAIKMGGVDPLRVQQPAVLMDMFEAYDSAYGSADILEKIYYSQFSSERAVIPSFKRLKESMQASRRGLDPLMARAFNQVQHDEPGHVGVGRLAAWELADRGRAQRVRMIDLALHIIAITIDRWVPETKNIPAMVSWAGSLVAAKATAMLQARVPGDGDDPNSFSIDTASVPQAAV